MFKFKNLWSLTTLCHSFQYYITNFEMKWLRNSLLERPVFMHSVANDANHYGQLGNYLLLLIILYFHSQRSERWDILRGYVSQLILNDPGRDQQVKTSGLSQTDSCLLGGRFLADHKYQYQEVLSWNLSAV